jgi:hypothetical protein
MNPLTSLHLRLASVKVGALLEEMAVMAYSVAENASDDETKQNCTGILMGIRDICRIVGEDIKGSSAVDDALAEAEGALSNMYDKKKPKKE